MDNLYKILEVKNFSSLKDVKKAYRKLSKKYHPDKKGGSKDKFEEITDAYDILKDKKKKALYDEFGFDFDIESKTDELLRFWCLASIEMVIKKEILGINFLSAIEGCIDSIIEEYEKEYDILVKQEKQIEIISRDMINNSSETLLEDTIFEVSLEVKKAKGIKKINLDALTRLKSAILNYRFEGQKQIGGLPFDNLDDFWAKALQHKVNNA